MTDEQGNTKMVHHWEQAEPGDTYDALNEIYKGNADRVKKGVQNRVGKIDKAIKGVQKKMDAIDNSDDFDEVAAQSDQYDQLRQQKDELEQQKKYWQSVLDVPQQREAERARKKAEEQAALDAQAHDAAVAQDVYHLKYTGKSCTFARNTERTFAKIDLAFVEPNPRNRT